MKDINKFTLKIILGESNWRQSIKTGDFYPGKRAAWDKRETLVNALADVVERDVSGTQGKEIQSTC